jgi:hypothetical protein
VKLESYATPPLETPQQRYASLHRAIECGLASDEIWKELADVCLRLGHGDEAVRCMRKISGQTMRIALASRLARLGLIEAPPEAFHRPPAHAEAPAASDAGAEPASRPEPDPGECRLRDHVVDAFHHLLQQHMPWVVLITTLAFPGVIGVGGFLTAGGSWVLLAAMAALPGLCVLATVGAIGRQVLVTSAEGQEVQGLPGFHQLVRDARRFLADAGLVIGSLLGPSLLALGLGVPLLTALPGLLIGAFFAPMAWVLRQLRGDYGALSPVLLVRAISRTIRGYPALAAVTVGLFLPAAMVTYAVFGRPVWVQIAIIGPLCVLPVFVASRLLGTWVDAQRHRLGNLLHLEAKARAAPSPVAAPAVAEAPAGRKPGPVPAAQPPARKPAAPSRVPGPSAPAPGSRARTERKVAAPPSAIRAKPQAAPAPCASAAPAQPAAAAPARPTRPAQPARSARAAKPAQPVRPAQPARAAQPATPPPARPAPRAIEGRGPSRRPADAPVLEHMPGAVVVSGAERRRHGAAAKRP